MQSYLMQLSRGCGPSGVCPGHDSQGLRLLLTPCLQPLCAPQEGVWEVPVQVLVPPADPHLRLRLLMPPRL